MVRHTLGRRGRVSSPSSPSRSVLLSRVVIGRRGRRLAQRRLLFPHPPQRAPARRHRRRRRSSLSRSRRRPPHRRRPRDEPGKAATQDGCVSLTRGRQTGQQGYRQPVDISGTCGYAIVGPVPEERDTGQEARGEFLLLSLCLRCISLSFSLATWDFFFLRIFDGFRSLADFVLPVCYRISRRKSLSGMTLSELSRQWCFVTG